LPAKIEVVIRMEEKKGSENLVEKRERSKYGVDGAHI
jgi:hypothetical protein